MKKKKIARKKKNGSGCPFLPCIARILSGFNIFLKSNKNKRIGRKWKKKRGIRRSIRSGNEKFNKRKCGVYLKCDITITIALWNENAQHFLLWKLVFGTCVDSPLNSVFFSTPSGLIPPCWMTIEYLFMLWRSGSVSDPYILNLFDTEKFSQGSLFQFALQSLVFPFLFLEKIVQDWSLWFVLAFLGKGNKWNRRPMKGIG